jgi:hypothetical protein
MFQIVTSYFDKFCPFLLEILVISFYLRSIASINDGEVTKTRANYRFWGGTGVRNNLNFLRFDFDLVRSVT